MINASVILLPTTASGWVYAIATLAYIVTVISIIAVVISENRNPVRSLAWVTAVICLPVVGVALYAFFGRSIRSRHKVTKRIRENLALLEPPPKIDENSLRLNEESKQQIRLARSLTGSYYFPGNAIDIFTSGKVKFEAFERDVKAACHYINIQYYIFEDDRLGHRIKDLLIGKAREGVAVRVIYDHVGSFPVKSSFFREMTDNGVRVEPFMRVTFPQLANRINWRNHRKVTVIDGTIGYIGGMNVADRYIDGTNYGVWRDTHLRITGPAVRAMQITFAVDWYATTGETLVDPLPAADSLVPAHAPIGIQLLTTGPTSKWSNIEFLFLKSISNAKRRVFIQTPYFLPTESLLSALQSAALSGVDVRVMFPRRCDSVVLNLASRSYVRECLEAGIKIYFYEEGMLHAKTVVVDDEFSTTGSTNFDFRSFEHNFECNALIYGREFNERMARVFLDDVVHCHCIRLSDWKKRPRFQRAKESLVRLLSPIL